VFKVEARGTNGHVVGRLGVPKDKLMEVEARGIKGQVIATRG